MPGSYADNTSCAEVQATEKWPWSGTSVRLYSLVIFEKVRVSLYVLTGRVARRTSL